MAVLETERRGPAAWLWLNRPEVRNALNDVVLNSISDSLKELEKDPACRVIVLAGRGQAFCAGGDLSRMEQASKMTKAKSKTARLAASSMVNLLSTCFKGVLAPLPI